MTNHDHGFEEAKQLFTSMDTALKAAGDLTAALLDTDLGAHPLVRDLHMKLLAYEQANAAFKGSMQTMMVGWLGQQRGDA